MTYKVTALLRAEKWLRLWYWLQLQWLAEWFRLQWLAEWFRLQWLAEWLRLQWLLRLQWVGSDDCLQPAIMASASMASWGYNEWLSFKPGYEFLWLRLQWQVIEQQECTAGATYAPISPRLDPRHWGVPQCACSATYTTQHSPPRADQKTTLIWIICNFLCDTTIVLSLLEAIMSALSVTSSSDIIVIAKF